MHYVHPLQSNPAIPALANDARNILPVMAKTVPDKQEVLGQRTGPIVQSAIPEARRHDKPQLDLSYTL
jgi:hypothetical protein